MTEGSKEGTEERRDTVTTAPFNLPPNRELIGLNKAVENTNILIERCEIIAKKAKLAIESLELEHKKIDKDIILQKKIIETQEESIRDYKDNIASADKRIREMKS